MRTLVTSGLIESPMAPAARQPAHMRKPTIAPPSGVHRRKFPLAARSAGQLRLRCARRVRAPRRARDDATATFASTATKIATIRCARPAGRARGADRGQRGGDARVRRTPRPRPAAGAELARPRKRRRPHPLRAAEAGPAVLEAQRRRRGVGGADTRASPGGELAIVDARPLLNAVANHMRGGYQHASDYGSTRPVHFCAIPNIHAVRAAFAAVAAGGGGAGPLARPQGVAARRRGARGAAARRRAHLGLPPLLRRLGPHAAAHLARDAAVRRPLPQSARLRGAGGEGVALVWPLLRHAPGGAGPPRRPRRSSSSF